MVLGFQVGKVGLQVRRAASGGPVRGAQNELPATVTHKVSSLLLGFATVVTLRREALILSRAASATPP